MSSDSICYGCQKIYVKSNNDDVAFICNCFHNEYPKYRCICRNCVSSKELILVPKDHSLSKIHMYQDYKQSKKCICCSSVEEFMKIPTNIRYET